jgi:hypothetical protein
MFRVTAASLNKQQIDKGGQAYPIQRTGSSYSKDKVIPVFE